MYIFLSSKSENVVSEYPQLGDHYLSTPEPKQFASTSHFCAAVSSNIYNSTLQHGWLDEQYDLCLKAIYPK